MRQENKPLPLTLKGTGWTALRLDRTSSSIEISWMYGSCGKKNRFDTVYVLESSDRVVVDVYNDPTYDLPPGYACAGVGLTGTFSVKLQKPIGDRVLLSHAKIY